MKYSISELKNYLPNISEIDLKEYVSKMEKKELVRLGIIAGAAGALTVTAAIIIAKKLRKSKTVQVIEVKADDLEEETKK